MLPHLLTVVGSRQEYLGASGRGEEAGESTQQVGEPAGVNNVQAEQSRPEIVLQVLPNNFQLRIGQLCRQQPL